MMPEYTDADVARLAEMIRGTEPSTFDTCSRRLLDQGVTLPDPSPDPAVVAAQRIRDRLCPNEVGRPFPTDDSDSWLIVAVRDLFTPEALAEAAAKVQEADR